MTRSAALAAPLAAAGLLLAACSGEGAIGPGGTPAEPSENPAAEDTSQGARNVAGETSIPDDMQLSQPQAGASIKSPLQISGQAPGTWYFEGSFPVTLETEGGEVIAESFVTASTDWMTEEQVEFAGQLEFSLTEQTPAILVLREDTSSGAENPGTARVPVVLLPSLEDAN